MNPRVPGFSRLAGMTEHGRLRPALSNHRQRPVAGAGGMAKLADLTRNPVELVVTDSEGDHFVCAERLARGSARLSCACSMSDLEGWCRHRVDLLCSRYGDVRWSDRVARRAFARHTGELSRGNADRLLFD